MVLHEAVVVAEDESAEAVRRLGGLSGRRRLLRAGRPGQAGKDQKDEENDRRAPHPHIIAAACGFSC
jgi:hypothetical protein